MTGLGGWVGVSGKIRREKQVPHPLKKRGFGMTWFYFGMTFFYFRNEMALFVTLLGGAGQGA